MNKIGFLFRGIFETFAPFGIFLYLCKKHEGRIQPYMTGILTLMIIVLPRKGLSALCIPEEGEWAFQIAISILIGAFCEEIGRYCAMKYVLTEQDTVIDAVCYGLGHGGMEMLALSQYPWEFFLASMGMISENSERMQMISEIVFLDNVEVLINDCTTIIAHIALSVLVHISVRYQKKKYFSIAIIMHAMLNISNLYGGIAFDMIWTVVLCYLTYQIYNQNRIKEY